MSIPLHRLENGLPQHYTHDFLFLDPQRAGEAPTMLLSTANGSPGNWRRELARFAPDLQVLIHHGAARNKETFAAEAAQHDICWVCGTCSTK